MKYIKKSTKRSKKYLNKRKIKSKSTLKKNGKKIYGGIKHPLEIKFNLVVNKLKLTLDRYKTDGNYVENPDTAKVQRLLESLTDIFNSDIIDDDLKMKFIEDFLTMFKKDKNKFTNLKQYYDKLTNYFNNIGIQVINHGNHSDPYIEVKPSRSMRERVGEVFTSLLHQTPSLKGSVYPDPDPDSFHPVPSPPPPPHLLKKESVKNKSVYSVSSHSPPSLSSHSPPSLSSHPTPLLTSYPPPPPKIIEENGGGKTQEEIINELIEREKYDEWVREGSLFGITTNIFQSNYGPSAKYEPSTYYNIDGNPVNVYMVQNKYMPGVNNIAVFKQFIVNDPTHVNQSKYKIVDNSETLSTSGLASCTGLAMIIGTKKFMAHLDASTETPPIISAIREIITNEKIVADELTPNIYTGRFNSSITLQKAKDICLSLGIPEINYKISNVCLFDRVSI